MKTLINLLLAFCLVVVSTEVFSQAFTVKAGLNLSTMLMKDNDDTYSKDFKLNPGPVLGIAADIPVNGFLSFEPGLLLSGKGFRIHEEESIFGEGFEMKVKTNLTYIEMPLNFKGTFGAGNVRFYATFGPYIGYGITGKTKYEVSVSGQTEKGEEDIEWGNDELKDDIKPLDFGLTAGAGVQIKSIQAGISYGLGISNVSPYSENGMKSKNRALGITVGYRFGK